MTDKIKALIEAGDKATQGEWLLCPRSATRVTANGDRTLCSTNCQNNSEEQFLENRVNPTFITQAANARDEIKAMYEEVERLRANQIPDGWAAVPVEPARDMLLDVGAMEGYEGGYCSSFNDHIEWWQAMIEAAQEYIDNKGD